MLYQITVRMMNRERAFQGATASHAALYMNVYAIDGMARSHHRRRLQKRHEAKMRLKEKGREWVERRFRRRRAVRDTMQQGGDVAVATHEVQAELADLDMLHDYELQQRGDADSYLSSIDERGPDDRGSFRGMSRQAGSTVGPGSRLGGTFGSTAGPSAMPSLMGGSSDVGDWGPGEGSMPDDVSVTESQEWRARADTAALVRRAAVDGSLNLESPRIPEDKLQRCLTVPENVRYVAGNHAWLSTPSLSLSLSLYQRLCHY